MQVYHDYLLPSLNLLPNDPEEAVRVAYALALAHLAAAAHEHLLGLQYNLQYNLPSQAAALPTGTTDATSAAAARHLQPQLLMEDAEPSADTSATLAAKVAGPGTVVAPGTPTFVTAVAPTFATAGTPATAAQQPLVRFDAEMAAVRAAVEKVVVELVTGTRSSSDIKRALLSHAHQLGLFFGRRGINDLLLPLLITCLNATEWQLRSSFFGAIAAVGPHTGGGTLGVFLLPCLEQVRWAVQHQPLHARWQWYV
jgi:hypothetical protein